MVEVMVSSDVVRLELTGLDICWSLKRDFTFPVAGIRSVYAEPTTKRPNGLRLPGTSIPGIIQAGTYIGQETREFWCVHFTGQSVVFELEGLPYTRVVVDVRDPEAVVQHVRTARYGSGASM